MTSTISPRFGRLRRRPRFRFGIQRLNLRRHLRGLRRRFAPERLIPIPDDAQSLEGKKLVYLFYEVRSGANQSSETSGRNYARLFTHFIHQALEDAVDQSEIAIVKSGLQAAHRIRSDHARGFANLYSWQACRALKQRVGGNANAWTNDSAHVLALLRNAIEGRRRAKV